MSYMKTISMSLLAALTVLTVLGVGTASASEPKAEPVGGFTVPFFGHGGTSELTTIPVEGKIRSVHCHSSSSTGEIDTATSARNILIHFKGCTATGPFGIKLNCTSPGRGAGEITTTTLKGTSVYYVTGSNLAGILIQPVAGNFTEFTCGGVQKMVVSGGVVGKLTPVNTLTKTYTLTFSEKEGKQEPVIYLANGGCTHTQATLVTTGTAVGFGGENFGPLQSGVVGSQTLTMTKDVKVNSTSCI